MSEPLEIELKFDLQCEENYLRMIEAFGGTAKRALQENLFFDTKNRSLEKAGWALRIRLEDDHAYVTLKGRQSNASEGLAVRVEFKETMPFEAARVFRVQGITLEKLPAGISKPLKELIDDTRLEYRLGFENQRTTIPYKPGSTEYALEFDRTVFPDSSISYELEVESSDVKAYGIARTEIARLLENQGIPVKFQQFSKLRRAIDRS